MSKQYGLILPGQQKKAPPKPPPTVKPCIFDESSEESADDAKAPPTRAKGPSGVISGPSLMERRVARRQQEKALAEDPTIFQYDEVYDEMDKEREEQKQKETKSKEPRKAKYINKLMEYSERRKLERELRLERQVQKEREAEGDAFKDKDTYVTEAYRQKLESLRQMQEQEDREEYLEAIGDVTRQKDLDGFYRHIYEQKTSTAKPKAAASTEEVAYKPIISQSAPQKRSYRQRRSSVEESKVKAKDSADVEPTESEAKTVPAHLQNNIDADSDFSIEESSDEEKDIEEIHKKIKEAKEKQNKPKERPKDQQKAKSPEKGEEKKASEAAAKQATDSQDNEKSPEEDAEKELPVPTVTKPIVDRSLVWRKRTVGEVFEAALARYEQRKRARQG